MTEPTAPDGADIPARIRSFSNTLPFFRLLGMQVEDVGRDWARLSLAFRDDLTQPAGILHGGVMAAIADSAIAHALLVDHPRDATALVSVDLRVRYFRPLATGRLTCAARIVRRGRQILHGEATLRDDEGREVARAESIYMAVAHERVRGGG